MAIKLFDSELKVMDILWRKGDQTAKQIADLLHISRSYVSRIEKKALGMLREMLCANGAR